MSTLDATAPVAAAPRSAAQFRRFARRNPTIVAGGSILIAIAVLALLAPLYAGDAITMQPAQRLQPPSDPRRTTSSYARRVSPVSRCPGPLQTSSLCRIEEFDIVAGESF